MDFIIENYIWIIIIAVILIMALIGYLAEKTDFVHANKTKKKERKQKPTEEVIEKTEDPSSDIPNVELEDPMEDKSVDADALLFDDPFAMNSSSNGMVEELPKEEASNDLNDDYIDLEHTEFEVPENLDEEPIAAMPIEEGVDPSLFAPVEKPKFGEEFIIPEDHLDEDKIAEEPMQEETESLVAEDSVEPVDTVEEIRADDIFSQPMVNNSKSVENHETVISMEDSTPVENVEVSEISEVPEDFVETVEKPVVTETVESTEAEEIPEIKDDNSDEVDIMDDWKF